MTRTDPVPLARRPWVVWIAGGVGLLVGLIVSISGIAGVEWWAQSTGLFIGIVCGMLIIRRGSDLVMGWWVLAGFASLQIGALAAVAEWLAAQGYGEAAIWASFLFGTVDSDSLGVLTGFAWLPLLLMVLRYPDGRLRSRWRWLQIAVFLTSGVTVIAALLSPVVVHGQVVRHPLLGTVVDDAWVAVGELGVLGAAVVFLVAIGSLIARYRAPDATWVQRQQLKWFGLGAATYVVTLLVLLVGELVFHVVSTRVFIVADGIAFTAIPLSIGLAILRYRLYDIDRIISRTLAYAIVVGLLAGVFVALVTAPFWILGADVGRLPPLAVSAATLAVAALFNPLRRRVQRAVDRRFDRARYDAEKVVAAFGAEVARLVDADAIRSGLRDAVTAALNPATLGIWLAEPDRNDDVAAS